MPSDVDALRRWLDDIRYHINLAQTFAAGMSYDVFRDDLRTIWPSLVASRSYPRHRGDCRTN